MDDRDRSFRGLMGDAEFVRKTLIVLGLGLMALLLWKLADVLLLAFGAVLVAILLHAASDALVRYLRVPERWSLTLASLVIFALFLAIIALFGTQVRSQFSSVVERLPFALDNFSKHLGIGPVSAAQAIVSFSHPGRCRNDAAFAALGGASPLPASSGRTVRHRLNRGGNRQANTALYRIVVVRLRWHQPTRDYLARRTTQGLSKKEIIRCLKRYVVREVFAALQLGTAQTQAA